MGLALRSPSNAEADPSAGLTGLHRMPSKELRQKQAMESQGKQWRGLFAVATQPITNVERGFPGWAQRTRGGGRAPRSERSVLGLLGLLPRAVERSISMPVDANGWLQGACGRDYDSTCRSRLAVVYHPSTLSRPVRVGGALARGAASLLTALPGAATHGETAAHHHLPETPSGQARQMHWPLEPQTAPASPPRIVLRDPGQAD